MAASGARRNFPSRSSSGLLVARGPALRAAASARGGRPHADADRARRHLRSSRRRLRALQRRREMARAAFREDALRQRAAHRDDDASLAREEVAALQAAHRGDDRLAACARWSSRAGRAASPRRSTPTARARRASSMCGVSPRSKTCSGPTDAKRLRRDLRRDGRRQFRRPQHSQPARLNRAARRRDRGASRHDADEAVRAARVARAPGLRRQGARRLERADDRGARQRRGCVRPCGLARGRGARLRFHLYTDELPMGDCCTLIAMARRRRRRQPTTTPT